jgi:phosphatidylglycerophosphate synthase
MLIDGAIADRRERLQRSALVGAGIGLAAVGLSAGAASQAFGLGPMFVSKAVAGFALVAAMVFATLPDHHPFARFGCANHVTLARAVLVALLAALIGEGEGPRLAAFAATLAGVAVALDFVDGRLARATGLASPFGARFDMETDAALVMVLAILAWQSGSVGPWVLASGLLRYAFVAAGWLRPWLRRPLPPSLRRRGAAAVQMVALVVVLAPGVPRPAATLLAAGALALLCGSFSVDMRWLHQHAEDPRS